MRWILELWRKVAVGSVYGIFAAYLRAWFIEGGFYMPLLFQIPSYKPGYILTIWEKLSQLFFCKQRQLQRCGCSHKLRWPSVTNSVTARVCGWQNHKVRTCSPSLERCPWALPGARSGGGGSRGSSAMGNGPGTAQRSAAPLCSRHGGNRASLSPAEQRWAALGSLIYGGAILPAIPAGTGLRHQRGFLSSCSEFGSAAHAAERLPGVGICVEILTVGHQSRSRWAMGSVGTENHRGVHGSWSASHVPGVRRDVKGRGAASTSAGIPQCFPGIRKYISVVGDEV